MASMTNARLVLSWPLLLVGNERKATAREIQASLLREFFPARTSRPVAKPLVPTKTATKTTIIG
jgi:hypothetical protein